MHLTHKLSFLFFCFFIAVACRTKAPVQSKQKQEPLVLKKNQETSTKREENTPAKKVDYKNFTLEQKIGQMVMMGINDRKLIEANDALREEITTGKVGGIIYFEKNISSTYSKDMLKKMSIDLQALAKVPLFISIDEEGGKTDATVGYYFFQRDTN